MVGGLMALAEAGWDPRGAGWLVGTSAGAVMAALLGAGRAPAEMLRTLARTGERGFSPTAAGLRFKRAFPVPLPASPRLALQALRNPTGLGPLARVAAWMPNGPLCTEPIAEMVRMVQPRGWVRHPHVWITAYDLDRGERVVFGRRGQPGADLADAVAASCAIPGLYHPVHLGGRRYVDGGVHSPSNLDVLERVPVAAVIYLNPTSSLAEVAAAGWRGRLGRAVRRVSGSYLGSEARALRRRGIEVLLLQPSAADLARMGVNLMRTEGLAEVIESARLSVAAQLREARGRADLPLTASLLGAAPARPQRQHRTLRRLVAS
jgi:NTE family protein